MWEIPQKAMIQLAAQRQVFIDHSQSMNIYIPHPNKEILKAIHTYTWQMGLKTGMYYLRSRSANDTLKIGSVAKNQQLAGIEDRLRDVVCGNDITITKDRSNLTEHLDTDMVAMMRMVETAQEKFQEQEEQFRDEVIQEALMSASRPSEVNMCQRNADGECISCQ